MTEDANTEAELRAELAREKKINAALMRRVERNMDIQGDAFSLFQAATVLEKKVHERTAALENVLAELKQSNRDLRVAKNAAEAAARSKDEFLAGMSHELRTPLNAVLGLSEILQEEIYGALNDKQQEALRTIESSGRHLLSLINDILEIARIGAGTLKMEIVDVNLDEVCGACVGLVRPQAEKKAIEVVCQVQPGLPVIQSDARRIKQIIVNLLGNAVKFTEAQGRVGLEVSSAGDELLIQVWDTGIGIASQDQARVFTPFVQLESSLSRRYDGTGLGLALVQQLVGVLGGDVRLESEVGQGSRFFVRLPVTVSTKVTSEPANEVAEEGVTPSGGRLILLAEDNEANKMTIGDYLRAKGYRVETADNGKMALEKVRELRPDLVLMDVQMPEMDGLEATRRIRLELRRPSLPVIALTALAMGGDRDRCIDAGANEYVTKPVSLKQLITVIEAQLGAATAA